MRINVSHRLAFFAALAVVVTTLGAARVPVTPTYASQLHRVSATSLSTARLPASAQRNSLAASAPLTAANFQKVALQGFGDPQNTFAWSMQWYKGKLYVGTNRAWLCVTTAMLVHGFPALSFIYPPTDPNLAIPCNPNPQALPEAGEIWSMDPNAGTPFTQTNWTEVYQSPYNVTVTITQTSALTMAARDIAFRGMSVYTDLDGQQALYVSGVGSDLLNGQQVPPPSLLRTTDGVTFTPVPSDPGTTMGNINQFACCLRGSVTYNGKFYLIIGQIEGAGSLFVSPDPRLGDNSFQQVSPSDMTVFEIQPFNGHLYLGLLSPSGYSVVRLNDAACTSLPCPDSAFTTIVPAGGGLGSAGNRAVTSMHVFTDTNGIPHLYVGTDGIDGGNGASPQPAEIVRINPDDSWDLVMGNPRQVNGPGQCNCMMQPLSGLKSGFNYYFNEHMWRMADYNGVLYVGTFDNTASFQNSPIGPSLKPYEGFDLWASADGVTFTPVTVNGFGSPLDFGVRTLQPTPYGLFLGSANDWTGLNIWQGALPTSGLQLAPQNLQTDNTAGGGTVALAWDAPRTATLFHVYRSTTTQAVLPPPPATADPVFRQAAAAHTLPHTIGVPSTYAEIGTTSVPYFVDRHAQAGGHYSYYVVAQDAAGHLSIPSNVTSSPSLAPAPTFSAMGATVSHLGAHGRLAPGQVNTISSALRAAQQRLQAGDARGSYDLLEALRQQVLSSASGTLGRFHAETVAMQINRLEKRVALVEAHVLAAQGLN